MPEYVLDQFSFRTKQVAKDYLSDRLAEHADGERVTDKALANFLTALALNHPDPAEKVGNGILYWVAVRNNDLGYSTRGFRNVQVDKPGQTRFSYSDVISPPAASARFAEALTMEAIEVTRQFRRDVFAKGNVVCDDTGQPITNITDAAAVHRQPGRAELHQIFLDEVGISRQDVALEKHRTESGYRLVDQALAKRWVEFQIKNLDGMRIVKVNPRTSPSARQSERGN